jgi:hypothetical protein
MYMKQSYGTVNLESGRQTVSNAVPEMNHILACNIIEQHESLVRIYVSCFQGLEKSKINVFLLFTGEEIDQGTRGIAAMPGTGYAGNAGDITGF